MVTRKNPLPANVEVLFVFLKSLCNYLLSLLFKYSFFKNGYFFSKQTVFYTDREEILFLYPTCRRYSLGVVPTTFLNILLK